MSLFIRWLCSLSLAKCALNTDGLIAGVLFCWPYTYILRVADTLLFKLLSNCMENIATENKVCLKYYQHVICVLKRHWQCPALGSWSHWPVVKQLSHQQILTCLASLRQSECKWKLTAGVCVALSLALLYILIFAYQTNYKSVNN